MAREKHDQRGDSEEPDQPVSEKPLKILRHLNGDRWQPARGRFRPPDEPDLARYTGPTAVDILAKRPDWRMLWDQVSRELKIRYYRPKSIKNYRTALRGFAIWFKKPPHELKSEDARNFLLQLVEQDSSASWVALNLTVIRTCIDKLGAMSITEGLKSPKKPRRLPNVLSEQDVCRILQAAPSLRDKLLLGIMYACGLRVSEACRLRWRDVETERKSIRVRNGKGGKDRAVMLPEILLPLLERGKKACEPQAFIFAGGRQGQHLTTRGAQLIMERAVKISNVRNPATCHTFRHSFATHMVEHGTDIAFIQKLLGHNRLETTRIYTHVSVIRNPNIMSPIDRLAIKPDFEAKPRITINNGNANDISNDIARLPDPAFHMTVSLHNFQITGQPDKTATATADAEIHIRTAQASVDLIGIRVFEPRKDWITLEIPPLEIWQKELDKLQPAQRQRIESAEFYESLRTHITRRFLALKAETANPSSG